MHRCFIAGAGEYCGFYTPGTDDYIIAADGGFAALISRGVAPDIVVGDFDSLGEIPDHPNVAISPEEKDDTDMRIAVDHGLTRGCNAFIIDGGLGGRLDHTLANMQLLTYIAKKNATGVLIGHDICVTAVANGTIRFSPGASGGVSVFCAGDRAEGVTITGLKYALQNGVLTGDYPIGVSNECIGERAEISVCNGMLIVTWECGLSFLEGL
ncbi:MAG: thiamine diphosphokinase [Oscillospiraceae bacterium]|nr:thiamine diphosphokinase [Oscillospiraceae bacterium]